jgi:hypothetical protein
MGGQSGGKRQPCPDLLDLVKGQFGETTRADLSQFFASLQGTSGNLVLHFHGGLVGRSDAHGIAQTLAPVYRDAGAKSLFLVWNTDLPSVLKGNLASIAAESIFWTLVDRVWSLIDWKSAVVEAAIPGARAPKRLAKIRLAATVSPKRLRASGHRKPLTGRRITSLTAQEERAIAGALSKDRVLKQRVVAIRPRDPGSRGPKGGGQPTLMSPAVLKRISAPAPGARGFQLAAFLIRKVITVVGKVIRRLIKKVDHGLYTTIIEEVLRAFYLANVGRAVWSAIKSDPAASFSGPPAEFGGAALLEELRQWWQPGRRLTLVGHSAGSVFILELLDEARRRGIDLRAEVVLMAPACSFERFHDALPTLSATVSKLRVYSLCDRLEAGYWEVALLYNASLLYLVSGILESRPDTPILGMQRYYSRERPYTDPMMLAVGDFLRNDLRWAPCDTPPQELCAAIRHGGFDRDPHMLLTLADIVRNGLR